VISGNQADREEWVESSKVNQEAPRLTGQLAGDNRQGRDRPQIREKRGKEIPGQGRERRSSGEDTAPNKQKLAYIAVVGGAKMVNTLLGGREGEKKVCRGRRG